MQVVRLHAARDVRLHEEADPVPAAGEVLVEIAAVGLCGSDRHWFLDGRIGEVGLAEPLVPCHEAAGVIASGPSAGTRVAIDPADPCGHCATCRSGAEHLCADMRFLGHAPYDGALRSRIAWPEHLLCPLPDSIGTVEAALLEPLGVALHSMDLVHVRAGEAVGVIGAGPIGLLLIQALRTHGCDPIVVSEPLPHRLRLAVELGAVPLSPDVPPLSVAFETSGDDAGLADAVRLAAPGARIALVGIPSAATTSLPAAATRRKELTLQQVRRMAAADLPRAIALAASGAVRLVPLISDEFPLAAAAQAFSTLADQSGVKVIIRPNA